MSRRPHGGAPGIRRRDLCIAALAAAAVPRAWTRGPDIGVDRWFTSSDGVRLHYLEAGAAAPQRPVLVFVPGWSMPAWIWTAQIRHFARDHRVLAFDPRGQGRSAVPSTGYNHRRRARDLAELLLAAEVDGAVLVGWSLGVLECLQALSETAEPDLRPLVRGLVLVDNSVGEGTPPPPLLPGRPSFIERLRSRRQATVEAFVRSMFKQPQAAPWLADLAASAMRLPLQASIALLGQPTPREFWRDTLYALDLPVLYVTTPRLAGQGALAQARRPSIESVVFEDAGHALFVDEAERFNALLDGFVLRLPAAPAVGSGR